MNMMDGFHREQEGRKISFIYFKALTIIDFLSKLFLTKSIIPCPNLMNLSRVFNPPKTGFN